MLNIPLVSGLIIFTLQLRGSLDTSETLQRQELLVNRFDACVSAILGVNSLYNDQTLLRRSMLA